MMRSEGGLFEEFVAQLSSQLNLKAVIMSAVGASYALTPARFVEAMQGADLVFRVIIGALTILYVCHNVVKAYVKTYNDWKVYRKNKQNGKAV